MNTEKITSLLLAFTMLAGTSCSAGETVEEEPVLSPKTYTFSDSADKYIKKIGRTYCADDGTLWLVQSASGIEFSFLGTSASVELAGDSNAASQWGKDSYARYAIYVDGERISDDMMTEARRTVEIFSSDTQKETEVRILKLSECVNSTVGIKSIDAVSVGDIRPTAEKKLKIEFIGDSITCGYGVDDEVKENHFKTDTEDATKAYACKTAEILDADYSLVSFSGHGIISGYTDNGKKQESQCVPDYYAKLGHSSGKCGGISIESIDWSFDSFVPDVVVVNLGTNDNSYTGTDETKQREYIDGYVKFLEQIRSYNPDAYILCTLGIMGDTLYPAVETAVKEYCENSGDKMVSPMKFDVQSSADGYAADWHPTGKTHEKAAQKLAAEIKGIMNVQ